jgi:ribosomal protein S4
MSKKRKFISTLFRKKNIFKPLYKQFINLRENVQNKKKPLRFKKKKWEKFIFFSNLKLRFYKKCKAIDQLQYSVHKKVNYWTSYSRRHKSILESYKRFKLFFGDFNRYKIKNLINKSKKNRILFLKRFESRLDTVLYRAKFSRSIRIARQLIIHGKILLNKKKIRSQSYILKSGDMISINNKDKKTRQMIEVNIGNANTWPTPPKNLIINYKTFQIIFITIDNSTNFGLYYHFNLNLERLLLDYKYNR